MLKETIHYEDFNGETRTVIVYFHLTEKQIVDLQAHSEFGIQHDLEEAIKSNSAGKVLDYITNLVHLSYGIKTQDGKNFLQTDEILADFTSAAYYSDFLMGLIKDNGQKGQEFVQGIMPKKLVDRAMAQSQGQPVDNADRTMHESTVYAPSAREQFANRTPSVTPENPLNAAIGQPVPPSEFVPGVPVPTPVETPAPQNIDPDYQEFLRQKQIRAAEQAAANTEATPFRVPAEEPVTGLPRLPHEQNQSPQQ